jgi:hypothetical protein
VIPTHKLRWCPYVHHPQVVILYVDEETSIKRQLQRARVANLHNRCVCVCVCAAQRQRWLGVCGAALHCFAC